MSLPILTRTCYTILDKEGDILNKYDIMLVVVLFILSLGSYAGLYMYTSASEMTDGLATVYYKDEAILEISLSDGQHKIINNQYIVSIDQESSLYVVLGDNGHVVIEYRDHKVGVIDEISPQNICQKQGFSNSPLSPITCLPNQVVIIITAPRSDDDPDDIVS